VIAAPCHRAGCVHPQCCPQRVRRVCSTSRHNISFERLRLHATAPDVSTYSATVNAYDGPAAPAGITLFRTVRCPAIAPEVFTYSAAIGVGDEPAAPTGITSLSCDAAPCHRAGGVHLHAAISAGDGPAAPAGIHLLRATRRHAIAPDVSSYSCRPLLAGMSSRDAAPCIVSDVSPTGPPPAWAAGQQHHQLTQ